MDKKEKEVVKAIKEPKVALNKKEQIVKIAKKVVAFLVKSGLWKYVKEYWHRAVSHTALGAALFTLVTTSPELSVEYNELKDYADSLSVVVSKQDSILKIFDGVFIIIPKSTSDTIK
jgi:hypothetical protein